MKLETLLFQTVESDRYVTVIYDANVVSAHKLTQEVKDYIESNEPENIEDVMEYFKSNGKILAYELNSDYDYISLENI